MSYKVKSKVLVIDKGFRVEKAVSGTNAFEVKNAAGISVYSVDYTGAVTNAGGASTSITDTIAFIPASQAAFVVAGGWTTSNVRHAANDWSVQVTATAADDDALQACFSLGRLFRKTTAAKGIKINSFKVAHKVTTANLGVDTIKYGQVVYAATAVNVVTDLPVTGGLTNTAGDEYLDVITVTSPVWLVTANADFTFEIAIAATLATCIWNLYGLYVVYDMVF